MAQFLAHDSPFRGLAKAPADPAAQEDSWIREHPTYRVGKFGESLSD